MMDNKFRVTWERTALRNLGKFFNIDYEKVYFRTKLLLSHNPYELAEGVADYPGFEFNGYFWTLINNVIIVYRILKEKEQVLVEACYYANTEISHQIFWGINPEEER
ncbi:hypothetical protein [Scopulibacillus cellulosilyticus]|uniref:Type II toxin-antitoxin system RelE/ParE family toxin n=1 Tax=Scopulibacillus cellulosilyticus TaxID=2665665 RepID=A0ABW2Q2Z8_9BACL